MQSALDDRLVPLQHNCFAEIINTAYSGLLPLVTPVIQLGLPYTAKYTLPCSFSPRSSWKLQSPVAASGTAEPFSTVLVKLGAVVSGTRIPVSAVTPGASTEPCRTVVSMV